MPQNLFGFELSMGLRWVIAFAILLVLLALLGVFLRRITGGRLRGRGQGGRTRQPRLGVVDIHDLDRQRQLVLIRRDNVEHLVMIGGASDVVIESNIVRGSGRVAAQAQAEFALPERPLAMDTTIPSESLRQDLGEEPRRVPPPAAPMPEQLPPLPHRSPTRTEPPSPAQVAASTAGPAVAAAVGVTQAPTFTRAPAPAPSASSGELDDMARQLEEALKRPFSAVRPAGQQSEPPAPPAPAPVSPPEAPKPQPAPPAARAPEPRPAAVSPPPPVPATPAPVPPAPVPAAPMAPPPVFGRPAGIPADVAAELEMALGLKPEPAPTRAPPPAAPPASPAPAVQVPPRAVIEPRSASSPVPARPPEPAPPVAPKEAPAPKSRVEERIGQAIEDKPEPSRDTGKPAAATESNPAEAKPVEAKPVEAKPAEARPAEPKPAEPKPAEPKPAEPKAEAKPAEPEPPAKPTQIDPFSVDAIEAEFARLLGRDPKSKS